jgi:D-3-phosphoglycerate dehydrogenase
VDDADAVLAGLEPYDADALKALPRLRCISRCGVGTDSIDLIAATERGITVLTTIDAVVEPVAQMTVAMIFALARNFPLYSTELRAGQWQRHQAYLLCEWTIGLIGFGRIGRQVERYLRPFSPRVIAADPAVKPHDMPDGVELRHLPSLLAEADLVSLHADRRPELGPLMGKDELAVMKRGSRLVNTARGHLVDEAALLEALQVGHLAGAALDVFQKEPYQGPLVTLPQVLCTPHTGSLTRASRTAMELRCAMNVVEFWGAVGQTEQCSWTAR